MAKGNRGECILAAPDDKSFFAQYLAGGVERYGIDLHAYCVMDNHYHLLLSDPGRSLTPFMHFLGSSYGTHMRRRRGMIGHIFSGRYKSICVQKEKYLVDLSRYIHLNPVRARMTELPEEYPWSSYRSYTGEGDPPPWLSQACILERFGRTAKAAVEAYRRFTSEGLEDPGAYPVEELKGQAILGDECFIKEALRGTGRDRDFGEVTARRIYESPMGLPELLRAVCRHCGVDADSGVEEMGGKGTEVIEIFIWLAKEKTTALNRDIAALTGHGSPSSIPHRLRRIKMRLKEDRSLRVEWKQAAEAILQEEMGSALES